MKCPNCNNDLLVMETRNANNVIVRRKKCKNCSHFVYTKEIEISFEEYQYLMKIAKNSDLFK